tara:strand:+ start:1755 stop:3248 length:1494 start_codon:yes stop_codon:yes gene_type:complete
MKKITLVVFLLSQGLGSFAQSFVLDTTFQPFFDITKQRGALISDMYESKSGKLYITGEFTLQLPPQLNSFNGIISIFTDGRRNFSFNNIGGGGIIMPISDSVFVNGNNAYGLIDTNGNRFNYNWLLNYNKSIKCKTGTPYFYSDGSSLFGNGRDNSGMPCPTIYNGDTLTRRHILKLTPDGLWDSTFTGDANHPPVGFAPYDSNRILIYGVPTRFSHYNGVRINGLCRIFLDGTLDTTFTSPMSTSFNFNYFIPKLVEKDGGFFLSGTFLLEDYPNQYLTLVRLKADGSLDSRFMNFSGPTDSTNFVYGVSALATTEDGGYLVGGVFNSYQGHAKNGIAKIDSNGKVQPQYFINSGPDSSDWQGVGYPSVNFIYKSKFGGYYVGGDFRKWNGKSVQPIVRITDLVTSVRENPSLAEKATIAVFPNPSNGYFTISSDEKVMAFSVIDLLGEEVISQPSVITNSNESLAVILSNHKDGIYFLRLTLEDGSLISKKLIKN